MATKNIYSTAVQLWSRYTYDCSVQCDITRSSASKTYTIKVTGIAARGSLWNFKSSYVITLGSKSASGTIPASGNNNYSGWMPKSGWHTENLPISVTVDANDDGSCPPVYLYFRCYNNNVKYISKNVTVSPSTVYSKTNIASVVESEIGKNDRAWPKILNPECTPVSTTKARVSFKTDCDCYYTITNSSNTTLAAGNTSANTTVSPEITTPDKDADYTLKVVRRFNSTKHTDRYDRWSFRCYSAKPPIHTFSMEPVTTTKAKATIECGCKFKWRIKRPDGKYVSAKGVGKWSDECAAETEITGEVAVSSVDGTYTLEVTRVVNGFTNTTTAKCNTLAPEIIDFSITPDGNTSGKMRLKTDCKCVWTLQSTTTPQSTGTVNTSVTSAKVTLDSGVNKKYTVAVHKSGYTGLSATATTSTKVDTTAATITISNVDCVGNSCAFTATSNVNCKNWYVVLTLSNRDEIGPLLITASETNSVAYTITNVPLNMDFSIKVYANKASNNVRSERTASTFKCLGIVYINISTQPDAYDWKPCAVYINKSTTSTPNWVPAIPYINASTDSDTTDWQVGVVN